MKILVTGAAGFIGKNLIGTLQYQPDNELFEYDLNNTPEELQSYLKEADIVFHLAGINRPREITEYETGNTGFTQTLCESLVRLNRTPKIIVTSSIQADLDNPYGISKKKAEEVLFEFSSHYKIPLAIYRLPNVFGKWCRPNYNSVVATFCHNVTHHLPLTINDPDRELELVYIDDVVRALLSEMENMNAPIPGEYKKVEITHRIKLQELADRIESFKESRTSLQVPDFSDPLTYKLYGTYLSYLDTDDFAYGLKVNTDPRGCLAEFIKSNTSGQIFVSRTHPGITRGNHFHDTKTEKFLVLEGEALIRFRHIQSKEIIEYRVSGIDFKVVDIPTGYTHSIENVGSTEMIVLFWASEPFNPKRPDTYFKEVICE